jgi:predicted dienelactone hydrolase
MYVDASRPTPAKGNAPGASTRTMATTVLYPASGPPGSAPTANAPPAAAGRPYPLLVFAHGFDATPAQYASLLNQWASAGYVVVAPTIPFLNADAPGGASHADYGVPNITDLDFALGEALRRSATPGTPTARCWPTPSPSKGAVTTRG